MPSPYSVDLRARVINSVQNGMSHKDASKFFQVGVATIGRWKRKLKKVGTLEAISNYQKGHSHKITNDSKFIKLVEKNKSATSFELSEIIGNISSGTVRKKLRDLGYSRKKRIFI